MLSCPDLSFNIQEESRTNMKQHPLEGRRMSDVKVTELHSLTPVDFVSYTNWMVKVRLDYLLQEGFVELQYDEEEPIYKCLQPDGSHLFLSETEVEDSMLSKFLEEIGRYI